MLLKVTDKKTGRTRTAIPLIVKQIKDKYQRVLAGDYNE